MRGPSPGALFESICKTLAVDTGALGPLRAQLSQIAQNLIPDLPAEGLVKSAYNQGLTSAATTSCIKSNDAALMTTMAAHLVAHNITQRPFKTALDIKYIPPEDRVEAFQAWLILTNPDATQTPVLPLLVDTLDAGDIDCAQTLLIWLCQHNPSTTAPLWIDTLHTIRGFKTNKRAIAIKALQTVLENDTSAKSLLEDALRRDTPFAIAFVLRERPDLASAFSDMVNKQSKGKHLSYTTQHLIRATQSAHGLLMLKNPALAPEILLAADAGNPNKILCKTYHWPNEKEAKLQAKVARQIANGRRKATPRPLVS